MSVEDEMVSGSGQLAINGQPMTIAFTVPRGDCLPEALLPDVQRLTNDIVDRAEARALEAGRKVSCEKGCGACCRQMVPISPAEARHLQAVVNALPPERAAQVRRRFDAAHRRLAETGLDPRCDPDADKEAYRRLGLAWFREGIPCPFLDDGACSIHPVRPLVCREYLVTSPAAHCAELGKGLGIEQIAVPVRVWAVFSRAVSAEGELEWMPLSEALEFAQTEPAPPPRRGPDWVAAFLAELQKRG